MAMMTDTHRPHSAHASKPTAHAGEPTRPRTKSLRKRGFLSEYLRAPGQVGALLPSSGRLAERMLEGLDLDRVGSVVEFGPGTGAFTGHILSRLGPNTRYFAMELNPTMASAFRQRFPHAPLHQRCVSEVTQACELEGIRPGSVDVIVSGLPFAAFPCDLQTRILRAANAALRPGGRMVTFAYHVGLLLPAGRKFARKLPEHFSQVSRSRSVLLNVPPAFVYRCVK